MKRFVLVLLFCPMLLVEVPAMAKPAGRVTKAAKTKTLQWPTISRRNQSNWVIHIGVLQNLLNFRGSRIEVDWQIGPQTEAAIKKFQRAHGLKADGIAGPQTLQKLIVRLKRGDRGDAVRGVQGIFAFFYRDGESATFNVKEDGVFGFETEKAVREFQAAGGLKVDGIVGPETWCALLGGEVVKK